MKNVPAPGSRGQAVDNDVDVTVAPWSDGTASTKETFLQREFNEEPPQRPVKIHWVGAEETTKGGSTRLLAPLFSFRKFECGVSDDPDANFDGKMKVFEPSTASGGSTNPSEGRTQTYYHYHFDLQQQQQNDSQPLHDAGYSGAEDLDLSMAAPPRNMWYIPNWIPEESEHELIHSIVADQQKHMQHTADVTKADDGEGSPTYPKLKAERREQCRKLTSPRDAGDAEGLWIKLKHRTLGNFGGVPHPCGLLARAFPPYLETFIDCLSRRGSQPNIIEDVPEGAENVQQSPLTVFGSDDMRPNQVLLNEYRYTTADVICPMDTNTEQGPRQGIGFHKDGPLFHPYVAILSLNAPATIQFRRRITLSSLATCSEPIDKIQQSVLVDGITRKESTPSVIVVVSVVLYPRSLFMFSGDAYTEWFHGIPLQQHPSTDASFICIPSSMSTCEDQRLKRAPSGAPNSKEETTSSREESRNMSRYSLTVRRCVHVERTVEDGWTADPQTVAEHARRLIWWVNSVNEKN